MKPLFDFDAIKFRTDGATFDRAVKLYEEGKVLDFAEEDFGFSAKVIGSQSKPYQVFVSAKEYDHATCDCYLGQNDTLCKHMVAAAIYAIFRGKKLTNEERQKISEPKCSGRLGNLTASELKEAKAAISAAMRFIKPYEGPSRVWFAYQDSLTEGCNRLAKIVSGLPVSGQTAKLLVSLLLRLDKKLTIGGVDDSDGTVGGFIESTVEVLKQYSRLDPHCIKAFAALKNKETCFGWEEPLIKLLI